MLDDSIKSQLEKRGVSQTVFERQLNNFKKGFPFLKIMAPATSLRGITILTEKQIAEAKYEYDNFKGAICKFVPASGAASRMFKDIYSAIEMLEAGKQLQKDSPAYKFIENVRKFPFFDNKNILKFTLYERALNYGSQPKGLILFHKYEEENRTAFEEHLVEGAMYAKNKQGVVKMVVTVSPEHMLDFKKLYKQVKDKYEKRYECIYNVKFTTQSPATDIAAVDADNKLFIKDDGEILFRPGGHGALLGNLNAIASNIIVVKNIDNVVHESMITDTVIWKKLLIGRALLLQKKIFQYLRQIDTALQSSGDSHNVSALEKRIDEMKKFLSDEFSISLPEKSGKEMLAMLKQKLNRPLRVCGIVKNEGEPGGGPFIIEEKDGATSLQILESSQIDNSNDKYVAAQKNSTHFNPVDLVCAVKDYKGRKFDLMNYTDPETGLISQKSYQGRQLKAQELPGLWNGAMSNWNTQFVEVPISTFNPVKTVLDLLRPNHLG